MTEPLLALEAAYADWKVIKTRGVVQLVFELDLQNADRAYKVLDGMPNSAKEVWVAIARLNMKVRPKPVETLTAEIATEDSEPNGRAGVVPSRRPPNPYARRAGILCNDIRFQKFLMERYARPQGIIDSPDDWEAWAAEKVRELCEVDSRAEILPNTPAANRFDILESAYRVETRI